MNEWRNTLKPEVDPMVTEWVRRVEKKRKHLQYIPERKDTIEQFRERMKARAREVGARIPGDANPIRRPVWD